MLSLILYTPMGETNNVFISYTLQTSPTKMRILYSDVGRTRGWMRDGQESQGRVPGREERKREGEKGRMGEKGRERKERKDEGERREERREEIEK